MTDSASADGYAKASRTADSDASLCGVAALLGRRLQLVEGGFVFVSHGYGGFRSLPCLLVSTSDAVEMKHAVVRSELRAHLQIAAAQVQQSTSQVVVPFVSKSLESALVFRRRCLFLRRPVDLCLLAVPSACSRSAFAAAL
jgi:hypothetical protein